MRHSTRNPLLGLCILSGFLLSCRGSEGEPLIGEWRIRMESADTQPVPVFEHFPISGALVFDRRLASYGFGVGGVPLPERALLGRAYLAIDATQRVSRNAEGIAFRGGPYADELEEMFALRLSSDREINFEFAPKVTDYGLSLQGTLSDDTVRGMWTWSSGTRVIASGPFTMWRSSRSAVTDSAIYRSRRAAQAWANPAPDKPTVADTTEVTDPAEGPTSPMPSKLFAPCTRRALRIGRKPSCSTVISRTAG